VNDLTIEARGERELVMTRSLDGPRDLVFRALTEPPLLRRWLGVRGGWTLAICEVDLVVGGRYRYVWQKGETRMGAGGVYREIVPPERLVYTEAFDDPWFPGEALGTTVLIARGETTLFTTTLAYESRAARDLVLASPMERGVSESYTALDAIVSGRDGL
jgi:uncharacterized protein YndB with AHSA1/START domain